MLIEFKSGRPSFERRGLILTFSGKHQHTFKNNDPILISLSLNFYLLYLLLNISDGNNAKKIERFQVCAYHGVQLFVRKFLPHHLLINNSMYAVKTPYRLLVALKNSQFSLADDRSGVLLPSCMCITVYYVDQQLRC